MDEYTLQLDGETGKHISLYLFINVQNTSDIRKKILNGNLRCCILKAALIIDSFQVVVAANKAVVSEKFGRLTTRTLFTEILYNLSLSKNITQSLLKFGIDDKEEKILVVSIHNADEGKLIAKDILENIDGERISISKLKELTDIDLVKRIYKIDDTELEIFSLVDSVVSRISIKDFASH